MVSKGIFVNSSATDIVNVWVSDAQFALEAKLFCFLTPLPWRINSKGERCLTTSVALFEVLLNYLLFDAFPETKKLSTSDVEELVIMALVLGLHKLEQHLQNCRNGWHSSALLPSRRRNSLGTRTTATAMQKPHHHQQLRQNSLGASTIAMQKRHHYHNHHQQQSEHPTRVERRQLLSSRQRKSDDEEREPPDAATTEYSSEGKSRSSLLTTARARFQGRRKPGCEEYMKLPEIMT